MWVLGLISVLVSAGLGAYQAYAGTVAAADAKKVMAKQNLEQQLQAVIQQNKNNKAKADAAVTQLGAVKAALSQPAPQQPDHTPLIVGGAIVAFLLLRKKL